MRQTFRQGREDAGIRALRCAGVALSVAAVAAAFASPARGSDDPAPQASPPVLEIANAATIAPDVPETAIVDDAAVPADEPAMPAAEDLAAVTREAPAKQDGWVEVRPAPSPAVRSAVPNRLPVVAHLPVPTRATATPPEAAQRRTARYHPRPRQYHPSNARAHMRDREAPAQSAMSRPQRAFPRSASASPSGLENSDDTCTSARPICPDVCVSDPVQNSIQNVAEIVRCIVNSALQEIGNSDDGSVPASAGATAMPTPESDSGGQYQCEDRRYHDPRCDSVAPATPPSVPPATTPMPDAAPVTPPTAPPPASAVSGGPASSATPVPAPGRATAPNADDGWQLVEASPPRHLVTRPAAVSAYAVPRMLASPKARAAAVPAPHKPTRPPVRVRTQRSTPHGPRSVALGPAAGAVPASGSEGWPLGTALALLALASLTLGLGAMGKVYGTGAAVAVRARLGSKGLSAAGRPRKGDAPGIRYRS